MELVLLLGALVWFFAWLAQPRDPTPPMSDEIKERLQIICLVLLVVGAAFVYWLMVSLTSRPAAPF